jgi:hypothetical protein
MTPHEELVTYLEAVHPPASAGFTELRALPSRARTFVAVGDVVGVETFMAAHVNENVYTGVATRRTRASGALENCGELWTLFVDLDFKTVAEADARARLEAFPLPPSLVVHSGGGLHVYWQLREPFALPEDAAEATSLLRRMAHQFGGDFGSAEPVRVLRLPGGFNHKTEYGVARPVHIEAVATASGYTVTEIEEWLPPDVPPGKSNGASHAGPFHVPPTIRDGSRNQMLYRAARSLHAKNFSAAAIVAAISAENVERCAPPLPQDEVDAIAAHAVGQADRSDFGAGTPAPVDGMVGLDAAFLADATVVAAQGQQIAADGVPFLVEGVLPAYGMLGMCVAFTKVGKTTFGIALGAAIAAGVPFLSRSTRQARVLFVAAEDPPEYTAYLARHLVALPPDSCTFYRGPLILDATGLAQIAETVRAGGYGLVLIATWQAVVRGLIRDENDNAGSVRVVEDVKACTRQTGVPWLIDAHSGKGEDQRDDADPSQAMRGASGAAGAADFTLSLRYGNGPFGTHRRLSGKGRFVTFPPVVLDYDDSVGIYTVVGSSSKMGAADTTWRLLCETGAIGPTLRTADAIARAAGLLSANGHVTGAGRQKVKDALNNRDGVRTTTEIHRGQQTKLYAFLAETA